MIDLSCMHVRRALQKTGLTRLASRGGGQRGGRVTEEPEEEEEEEEEAREERPTGRRARPTVRHLKHANVTRRKYIRVIITSVSPRFPTFHEKLSVSIACRIVRINICLPLRVIKSRRAPAPPAPGWASVPATSGRLA